MIKLYNYLFSLNKIFKQNKKDGCPKKCSKKQVYSLRTKSRTRLPKSTIPAKYRIRILQKDRSRSFIEKQERLQKKFLLETCKNYFIDNYSILVN